MSKRIDVVILPASELPAKLLFRNWDHDLFRKAGLPGVPEQPTAGEAIAKVKKILNGALHGEARHPNGDLFVYDVRRLEHLNPNTEVIEYHSEDAPAVPVAGGK